MHKKAFRAGGSVCHTIKQDNVSENEFTDLQNRISLVKSKDRKTIETP